MISFSRKIVTTLLSKLQFGHVCLIEAEQSTVYGDVALPQVTIMVKNPKFYQKIIRQGSLGAAQSYLDGDWQVSCLSSLISLMIKNQQLLLGMDKGIAYLMQYLDKVAAYFRRNTIANSKKNILAHYDLSNDFFELFLDDSMMYSCAIFTDDHQSLWQAQQNKLKMICEKLTIMPGDKVLEIGSGWGGMAIYLATHYQCHVTTTTISEKQYQYVHEKIQQLQLSSKITLLKKDYRDLEGKFDKIVSIEMLEAVGHQFYDTFFHQCDKLLHHRGKMLLQTITINEQNYERAKSEVDFIKKFIFPGGCLPSIARLAKSVAHQTRLHWMQLDEIGEHYAQTLAHWQHNFTENINSVRNMGFDEKFIRMWCYYFSYCHAGFTEQYISNVHLLLQKR